MLKKMNDRGMICDPGAVGDPTTTSWIPAYAGMTLLFACIFLTNPYHSFADAKDKILPRFVTIKSDKVNARTGPGVAYPIEWVFISRGEPIKVIAEFEQWRKVEDISGLVGWVHSSVLSPKRSVIIKSNAHKPLFRKASKDSRLVAKLENGLRCNLDKVEKGWCKIKCKGYKGWIESSYVWGLSKTEEL